MHGAIECIDMGNVEVWLTPMPAEAATRSPARRNAERSLELTLLSAALGHGARLAHHPWGQPYVEGQPSVNISFSHSRHLLALAVADTPVGIDIETMRTDQLRRVAPRFLSAAETGVWDRSSSLLLAAWTLKEAIYKAIATGSADLRTLPLPDVSEAWAEATPFAAAPEALTTVGHTALLTRCGTVEGCPSPSMMAVALIV